MAINCAAIPETLLESELFGYEKGAFTDARAQKKGILEMASGGTVFLDEIGEMSMALQAKLLRVLENQVIRRLGGTSDIKVDVRVITATNQDLWQAIQHGRFRLDLYYRLNVIQIVVPPLREHREDILPLVNHFVASYNVRFKRNIKGVSPEGAHALAAHGWPGNIRELRNAIERAMVLEQTSWIGSSSLGLGPVTPARAIDISQISGSSRISPGSQRVDTDLRSLSLAISATDSTDQSSPSCLPPLSVLSAEEGERQTIATALRAADNQPGLAAKLLKMSRTTLYRRMKQYQLS